MKPSFAAAIAAILWSYAEPGLLRTLCYNLMVVSGFATLAFNANPLLRYDGYHILSDWLEVPNLQVLPCGPLPPNPAELLQSERFRQWLRKMETRFDHIILDSPPLVAVTDSAILSTIADGTLIVVRAFKTRKELAQYCLRTLHDVSARVAGIVLNAVNLDRDEYRYSYQYYRRDTYYADPTAPRTSKLAEPEPPRPSADA